MSVVRKTKRLVVATAVSEMVPFAKTGGMADVAGALPVVLSQLGHTCYSFLPAYRIVRQKWFSRAKQVLEIYVPLSGGHEKGAVWRFDERPDHTVFFIEHDGFFDRDGLYGTADGDYPDNAERFAFFSRAVVEALRALPIPGPDVLHVHDWQSALIPVYLKERYREEPRLNRIKTLLTIHNMAYQGVFDKEVLPLLDLPWDLLEISKMEFWGKLNLLKGGLVYADYLTTVSPTYAREIQTPDNGAGLDGLLRSRSNRLKGILNGIDTEGWNPEKDESLYQTFSADALDGKVVSKRELQRECGLDVSEKPILIGMVGRLADQKGLDIVFEALPEILNRSIQLVILGTGDRVYHEKLIEIKSRYPKKVFVELGFNNKLAHRIYAGSDVFLMPSRFEPCGLGQLISFRYGTIPIVRRTGGLADTVIDLTEHPGEGNGFVFSEYSRRALLEAISRAEAEFHHPEKWAVWVCRLMQLDFSWERSAQTYAKLYHELLSTSKNGERSAVKTG